MSIKKAAVMRFQATEGHASADRGNHLVHLELEVSVLVDDDGLPRDTSEMLRQMADNMVAYCGGSAL